MKILVFCDHRLVGEHPAGSESKADQDRLLMTEPDGLIKVYEPGEWHAAGPENRVSCGFVEPRVDCPNCVIADVP